MLGVFWAFVERETLELRAEQLVDGPVGFLAGLTAVEDGGAAGAPVVTSVGAHEVAVLGRCRCHLEVLEVEVSGDHKLGKVH